VRFNALDDADSQAVVRYVLGDMTADERIDFEIRMSEDDALAAGCEAARRLEERLYALRGLPRDDSAPPSAAVTEGIADPAGVEVRKPPNTLRHLWRPAGIAAIAAGVMLTASLWLSNPAVGVKLDFRDIRATPASSRGDSPRVHLRFAMQCSATSYVSVLAIHANESRQLHPREESPLTSDSGAWPTDPFVAGSMIQLPPEASYPFSIPDGSFVVVCAKENGGYSAEELRTLRSDIEAAAVQLDLMHAPVTADDPASKLVAEKLAKALRTNARSTWTVECWRAAIK
jgi:hypothetical protein